MTRVALRGIAARRLRTALTALAIVLGVAMVSGATRSPTRCAGAADSLSSRRLRRDRRRRHARKTAFKVDTATVSEPPADARVRARPRPRGARRRRRRRRHHRRGADRRHRTARSSATARTSASASTPATPGAALTPFRLQWAAGPTGPGEVVIDAGTAEKRALRASATRVTIAGRRPARDVPRRRHRDVRRRQVARHAPRSPLFDLHDRAAAVRQGGGYDDDPRRRRPGVAPADAARALHRARCPARSGPDRARRRTASRSTASSSSSGSSSVLLLAFGGVAMFVGAFTIFNTLSITVAQRSRELALLRTLGAVAPPGAALGPARGARRSASSPRSIGLAAGIGLAKGLSALFEALGLDLPQTGTVFAHAHGRRLARWSAWS